MQIVTLKDNQSSCFDLITYPDGQHTIRLRLDKLDVKQPVRIRCRIRYFAELEVLYCLCAALLRNDFIILDIHYMYLFGQRSDRAFAIGEPNYWRDIMQPLLTTVKHYIFYPHNILLTNNEKYEFTTYDDTIQQELYFSDYYCIAGDLTALTNINSHAVNYFRKRRTTSGIKIEIALPIHSENRPILVCDDLCDGGATFVAIGKYLKERYPDRLLNLFVVHGLFSKGFSELLQYYDKIFCTNSYQDIDHPKVTCIKVI